ncbi:unnamed protein product [Cylicocyclus nassatus]|uniref:RRM domain-containing protein n=1 Tax=Cylicocyclus nassatus TaxID=53992 RepID=A0AA36DPY8_CYLNA|nr:unnamed protein product [Cylicocyclus nassatus]
MDEEAVQLVERIQSIIRTKAPEAIPLLEISSNMEQAYLPSGPYAEKGFCVKNIPVGFNDWDIFHLFRKFGIVHNVKIPTKQGHTNCKYGFVVMEDFNGVDEVRNQLKNGKFLAANGVCLQVSSVHHGEQPRPRLENGESSSRPPLKDLQHSGPGNSGRNRVADRQPAQKPTQPSTSVKCFPQDLPLDCPVNVRVVDSPYPSDEKDFVFHVIPVEQKLGEEYAVLQREMNKYCLTNPNLPEVPQIGEYALFGRASIAYRALCNSEETMYLVDTGETVAMNKSQLWTMTHAFSRLPTLVIPCKISNIEWKNPSATTFDRYKKALSVWSRSLSTGLKATACGYAGLKNLVTLAATTEDGKDVDDFATAIANKGVCTQTKHECHRYSREDVLNAKMALKDKDYAPLINCNENISEIITSLQTMSVA